MKNRGRIGRRRRSAAVATGRGGALLIRFLPSTFTISAFCFGLTSVRFSLFHKWEHAVTCVLVAALLDALDGKVARLLGQSSRFGAELDSLSDLVCFGVAPSIVLFLMSAQAYGRVGWSACMFYTICCGLRLARFNAMLAVVDQRPEWMKRYFSGVPAPAGAVLVMFPVILFFETENRAFLDPPLVICCLLMSGGLMISTMKTFSSKMLEITNCPAFLVLLSISFVVICLITEPWLTLSALIVAYIVSVPCGVRQYSRSLEMEEALKEEQKAS